LLFAIASRVFTWHEINAAGSRLIVVIIVYVSIFPGDGASLGFVNMCIAIQKPKGYDKKGQQKGQDSYFCHEQSSKVPLLLWRGVDDKIVQPGVGDTLQSGPDDLPCFAGILFHIRVFSGASQRGKPREERESILLDVVVYSMQLQVLALSQPFPQPLHPRRQHV
jgi:hypothetical protein